MPHTVTSSEESRIHPPHYLHELPHEDEERLAKLFTKLDADGNGNIDIHELSVALREFGVPHKYAEKFIKESDKTQSGAVSLADFIHYVREHEKNLKLHFSHLDRNRDESRPKKLKDQRLRGARNMSAYVWSK